MGANDKPEAWHCGRFIFDFNKIKTPLVMGILNATPDSFSDGGRFSVRDDALRHAEAMINNEVDIIDIGGESTRPGAKPVGLQEELDRVLPLIEALHDCGVALSIDTYKAETMRAALEAGVDCVNDIWALRLEGSVSAIRESNCGLVLMHMQCDPLTMQFNPEYTNVVAEIKLFLQERCEYLLGAGIHSNRIAIDPGFGFGKSLQHNLEMLNGFVQFSELTDTTKSGLKQSLRFPVLAGLSRKSMLGKITGRDVNERLAPSIAASIMAADRGASIVRVHDVAETVDAFKVWQAIRS